MRNSWLALFSASATAADNELMRLPAQKKINSLLDDAIINCIVLVVSVSNGSLRLG
jgi:hypothetical protein